MALLTQTAQVLQQMSILLKCCPSEEVSLQEWSPLPQSMLSPLAMSFAGDVLVAEVKQALEVWITSMHSYMANPIRNRILRCNWLPEWTLTVSRKKRVLFLCNKSFIDQPCRLDKHAKKKNLFNIQPFWPHAWSPIFIELVHEFFLNTWFRGLS